MTRQSYYSLMQNIITISVLVVVALMILFQPASAQGSSTTVVVPWGDMVASFADIATEVLVPLLLVILARLAAILPAPIAAFINTNRVEQLLERAVQYGINATAGAARDKRLTVDVGNVVVANALNYAIAQGPSKLIGWVGGKDALTRMIIARLDLSEYSTSTSLSGGVT